MRKLLNKIQKDLNRFIGSVFYRVNRSALRIDTFNIKNYHINEIGVKLFYNDSAYGYVYLDRDIFFNLEKAKKVLDFEVKKCDKASKKHDEYYKLNEMIQQKIINGEYNHLIGKTVKVKFTNGEYKKVKIDLLHSHALYGKKHEYIAFTTKPDTNTYLLHREGKNWYFWTDKDELNEKKQKLLKELEKIDNELSRGDEIEKKEK